ncbi:hypothetical protein [Streptomyces sp. CBMA123]|uniref:hypothetical protein n=1 Tax=Streptomyces sp. CBMA123 TaxID=1896313 RepID=UPI001661B6F7|nr:hypothetical protein [Streptomyces sp. CBMA123]MBD0694777.1 hypothetical protein [Streptomyces sp. CBMA123]
MNKMTTAIVLAASAAVAVTGITYASAASEPVTKSAPVVEKAALAAAPALPLDGGTKNTTSKGDERREHRGVIHINERTFSADDFGCITVVSGLGAKSLNVRNDSHRTIELFSGAVCDNGAPIATVGPHSFSDGVRPRHTEGLEVEDGVVGSFRIVHHDLGFGEHDKKN